MTRAMALVLTAATVMSLCGSAAAAESTRPLTPKTVAWWTFDGHLRDEVRGLTLANVPHPTASLEKFYVSIQFVSDVPRLAVAGKTNWRGY